MKRKHKIAIVAVCLALGLWATIKGWIVDWIEGGIPLIWPGMEG